MNKPRADALWNQLSAEQLETLDRWLFEENLSYTEALPRAQKELGFKGELSSLKRYYQRRSQQRVMEEVAELKKSPGDMEALRVATMKMLAAQAFQQVQESPKEVEKWGQAVKLMVDNDRNEILREGHEIRRELREGDQAIRREAIEFARDKFQYDMVERAVRALPQLQRLAEAMSDPDPKRYQDNPHWNEAREIMFEPRSEDKASAFAEATTDKEP